MPNLVFVLHKPLPFDIQLDSFFISELDNRLKNNLLIRLRIDYEQLNRFAKEQIKEKVLLKVTLQNNQ